MSVSNDRNNNIGVLHLIGALFVLYGHQCVLLQRRIPILFGGGIHSIGVKLIFVISGYLITRSLCNIKGTRLQVTKKYFIKRLSRIYPEFFGCLIISAFVIGPIFTSLSIGDYFSGDVFKAVLAYVLKNLRMYIVYGLPGVFNDSPVSHSVNGSIWTLPVELFFYFIVFVLIISFKNEKIRKSIFLVFTIALTFCALWRMQTRIADTCVFYGTDWFSALNIAPYFFWGGLASLFDIDRFLHPEIGAILAFSCSGIYFASVMLTEILCLICLTYFVLSVGFSKRQVGIRLKFIKSEYAYGIYLYGFVVQQCVIVFLQRNPIIPIGVNVCFALSVVICYLLAMLSYKIFYIPMSKLVKRFVG